MIALLAAFFLVSGFVYEIAPPFPPTLSQAVLDEMNSPAGRATREFLSTFSLPGTPDPIVGTPADFVFRDEDGVWRPAPVVRIQ